MNFQKITVNQESCVCAPRIHTSMSCKKLPTAIVGFCGSWLTFSLITHSIYRLIHCGQNTVSTGKPTIQQWVFLSKLAGKNLREIIKRSCLAMSNQSWDKNAINAKQRKITYSLQGEETILLEDLGITNHSSCNAQIIF